MSVPVVLISSTFEWRVICELFRPERTEQAPYGSWFRYSGTGGEFILYNGGWGKISAAASAQYALDRWRPDLLVNIGTCGGFEGAVNVGEIILVNEARVYDLHVEIGDQEEEEAFYTVRCGHQLAQSAHSRHLPGDVRTGIVVSADRDVRPDDVPLLTEKYGALAADWESASIAFAAAANGLPWLILRGVSDLVGPSGGSAYGGNDHLFHQGVRQVMGRLFEILELFARQGFLTASPNFDCGK